MFSLPCHHFELPFHFGSSLFLFFFPKYIRPYGNSPTWLWMTLITFYSYIPSSNWDGTLVINSRLIYLKLIAILFFYLIKCKRFDNEDWTSHRVLKKELGCCIWETRRERIEIANRRNLYTCGSTSSHRIDFFHSLFLACCLFSTTGFSTGNLFVHTHGLGKRNVHLEKCHWIERVNMCKRPRNVEEFITTRLQNSILNWTIRGK